MPGEAATSSSIPAPAGRTSATRRSDGARWPGGCRSATGLPTWVAIAPGEEGLAAEVEARERRRGAARCRPGPPHPGGPAPPGPPGDGRRLRPDPSRPRPGHPGPHAHGPDRSRAHGPYGAPERALWQRLPCSFCYRRFDETKACLLEIPADRVAERAAELLALGVPPVDPDRADASRPAYLAAGTALAPSTIAMTPFPRCRLSRHGRRFSHRDTRTPMAPPPSARSNGARRQARRAAGQHRQDHPGPAPEAPRRSRRTREAGSAPTWSSSGTSPTASSSKPCPSTSRSRRSTSTAWRSTTAVIKIIPADIARKYTILPVTKAGATVTVAMIDPTNVFAMDDVKFMTGYKVEPVVASETAHPRGDRPLLRLDPRHRAQEGHGGPLRGVRAATSRSWRRRRSSTSPPSRRSPSRRRSSSW